jgi:hypothetical protein
MDKTAELRGQAGRSEARECFVHDRHSSDLLFGKFIRAFEIIDFYLARVIDRLIFIMIRIA